MERDPRYNFAKDKCGKRDIDLSSLIARIGLKSLGVDVTGGEREEEGSTQAPESGGEKVSGRIWKLHVPGSGAEPSAGWKLSIRYNCNVR